MPDEVIIRDVGAQVKVNINESIDTGIYEQRLYDLKHLIVEKLLDNLDECLLYGKQNLNGTNAIAYLQLLLSLTIEFASKFDEDNHQFIRYIIKSLLRLMIFIKDMHRIDLNDLTEDDILIKRRAHTIQRLSAFLFFNDSHIF